MRILLVSAASSVHTQRWANAFVERGHEVHLVSLHTPLPGYHADVRMILLPFDRGRGYATNRGALRKMVRTLAPDVVNAHYATGYGTLATGIRDRPVVLNVWGSDVYDFPEKGALHRWWLRRMLRRASHVVSTSHAMAARTVAVCPGLPLPTVVPFGVDTAVFHPSPVKPNGRPVVVGTVKTMAAKYGIDTLIEAFALLVNEPGIPPCSLRIVGDGPDLDAFEILADVRGIADRTVFVGAVPHAAVPDELRALDIYVALSRHDSESFGVAAIEASACGLPVVVSDVSGLKEVTRDGVTGTVVRREDPRAAANAIAAMVRSVELRMRMGNAGIAHVKQEYEWSACVDRMLDVLTSVSRTHG